MDIRGHRYDVINWMVFPNMDAQNKREMQCELL